MEFFVRREQYYWPVRELIKLGHPLIPAEVTEFGRLSVSNNVLSKRKIIDLIREEKISGFDDPRLLTIRGLRRRGFPPELLRKIISDTTSMGRVETEISEHLINHYLRNYYDAEAVRVFGVLNPLKVIIDEPSDNLIECIHPNHPKNDMGTHAVTLKNTFYINESDFRDVDDPTYYRLAPGKTIRLKYADFYSFKSYSDKDERSVRVVKTFPENPKKIKGVIHWVNESAIDCIFEEYESLMTSNTFNNVSKSVHTGKIELYALEIKDKPLQLERVGYFKFDRYDGDTPVFIRIIDFVDKYNK
jgi:glutaminyl-tRNA synthetase